MNKLKYIEEILSDKLMSYIGDTAEEIRIRINRPVTVMYPDRELVTDITFNRSDMANLIERITKSSLYAFSDDLANGFITAYGGHRIGVAGTAVYENGKIKAVKDISYINIRIAHEMKGIGEGVYAKIVKNGKIANTLIVSPPNGGKTTLLRDLTRLISDNVKKCRVSVIDERNEISAVYMGEPQNDIGKRTDVLNGYSKPDGIIRALRSMSPDVIILDEIGGNDDENAVFKCGYSGVSVIASVHGENVSDIKKTIPRLLQKKVFEYCIFIDKTKRTCKILSAGDIND